MTKDFLLRLTEEHYGAGAFPVYGRLLEEQRRIEAGQGVNDELLDTIRMLATIMNGMQEDFAYDR